MESTQVIRITMFKIPKKEDQETMVKNYAEVFQTARKDGKPYILSQSVGPILGTSLSPGYPSGAEGEEFNFIGRSVFRNLEDMWFYDKDCLVHNVMRRSVVGQVDIKAILTTFYTPAFEGTL